MENHRETVIANASSTKQGQPVPLLLAYTSLLSGLSCFVPVPLLDDFLGKRVVQHMVASLLKHHGRNYRSRDVVFLYDDGKGLVEGCFWFVVTLPWKLFTKLISKLFKTIFFVFAIRDAALAMGSCLLLGRTLDRLLDQQLLPNSESEPLRAQTSVRIKKAFDQTFKGSDLRLLSRALGDVLRGIKELPALGAQAVHAMFRKGQRVGALEDVPQQNREAVERGVENLNQALQKEDVASFLKDFDSRFDQALEKIQS